MIRENLAGWTKEIFINYRGMGWGKMQEEGRGDVKKNGTVHQLYINTSTLLYTVYTVHCTGYSFRKLSYSYR
jgi:hypothetical protein